MWILQSHNPQKRRTNPPTIALVAEKDREREPRIRRPLADAVNNNKKADFVKRTRNRERKVSHTILTTSLCLFTIADKSTQQHPIPPPPPPPPPLTKGGSKVVTAKQTVSPPVVQVNLPLRLTLRGYTYQGGPGSRAPRLG